MQHPLLAQESLTNFFVGVQYQNPGLALRMANDIRTVALYALSGDRKKAYKAVVSVRQLTQGLPAVYAKILDLALEDLGYSLSDVYKYSQER